MQRLTGKAQDKACTRVGGTPVRSATMVDPELVKKYLEFVTFREALKDANADRRPIIPMWDKINVQAPGVDYRRL